MEWFARFAGYWELALFGFAAWLAAVVVAVNSRRLSAILDKVKTTTEILAILVAAMWVYNVFVYEELVRPALETPLLDITSAAQFVGEKDDAAVLSVTSTLKNEGKVTVFVLAYWFNVHAYTVSPAAAPATAASAFERRALDVLNQDRTSHLAYLARYFRPQREPESIHLGPLLRADYWLEPGEQVSVTRTLFVPARFDVAQVEFSARTAKRTDEICITWEPSTTPGERMGEIRPITWLRADARQSCEAREALVRYDGSLEEHRKIRAQAGLSTVVARSELALIPDSR